MQTTWNTILQSLHLVLSVCHSLRWLHDFVTLWTTFYLVLYLWLLSSRGGSSNSVFLTSLLIQSSHIKCGLPLPSPGAHNMPSFEGGRSLLTLSTCLTHFIRLGRVCIVPTVNNQTSVSVRAQYYSKFQPCHSWSSTFKFYTTNN